MIDFLLGFVACGILCILLKGKSPRAIWLAGYNKGIQQSKKDLIVLRHQLTQSRLRLETANKRHNIDFPAENLDLQPSYLQGRVKR